MPVYSYAARNKTGKKVAGVLFAKDELELANKLSRLEQMLISASEQKVAQAKEKVKLKQTVVLNLTMNLAAFLNGGLSLIESLNALIQDSDNQKLSAIILSLKDYIEAGGTFKDALALHPQTFSSMYRAIVASGEKTGKLDVALEDIANYLEWSLDLRAKIKELATYPVLILIVMIGVVSLLVGWVLPKFEPVFASLGTDLPLITKIVMQTSKIFSKFWYLILGGIFLLWLGIKLALKNALVKFAFDRFKLKVPLIGNLSYKLAISRFSHLMALCAASGVSIIEALGLGADLIGNRLLARGVKETRSGVLSGGELAAGFRLTGIFPSFMIRMVGVGERSGDLPRGFNSVCRFYDKEIPRVIQRLFAVLEPLMIVVMGLVVGTVALAVFLPLMKMTESVG